MTQQYYRDNLLPKYVEFVEETKRRYRKAILQEDNDSSHETRPNKSKPGVDNVCEAYCKDHHIETLKHPVQSPDLNPQEGCWNVLRARFEKRPQKTNSIKAVMDICQEIWAGISQKEVQVRIQEMEWRPQKVIENEGKAVKLYVW